MEQTATFEIKVKFTEESYKKLTQELYEAISKYNRLSNEYMLLLAAPAGSDAEANVPTVIETLENMSVASFEQSRLAVALYGLESEYEKLKSSRKVRADFTIKIDNQNVAILRDYLSVIITDLLDILNQRIYSMRTAIQTGQSVYSFTSQRPSQGAGSDTGKTVIMDDIRTSSNNIALFSDILDRIEMSLQNYAKKQFDSLAVLN